MPEHLTYAENKKFKDRQHAALKRARGKAAQYPCADCNGPAREWSQRHDTSGDSPEDFEPRCRSCHIKYDLPLRPHLKKGAPGKRTGQALENLQSGNKSEAVRKGRSDRMKKRWADGEAPTQKRVNL